MDDAASSMTGKPRNPMIGVILCAVAALLLLTASFTKGWLANGTDQVNVGIGLWSTQLCIMGKCDSMSNGDLVKMVNEQAEESHSDKDKVSGAFVPMGYVTLIGNLIAALALGATAFLTWKGLRKQFPIAPPSLALLSLMITLITGCVFIGTKPGGVGAVGVGWSFWLFAIGNVCGIIGAQQAAKFIRPPDEAWTA